METWFTKMAFEMTMDEAFVLLKCMSDELKHLDEEGGDTAYRARLESLYDQLKGTTFQW